MCEPVAEGIPWLLEWWVEGNGLWFSHSLSTRNALLPDICMALLKIMQNITGQTNRDSQAWTIKHENKEKAEQCVLSVFYGDIV